MSILYMQVHRLFTSLLRVWDSAFAAVTGFMVIEAMAGGDTAVILTNGGWRGHRSFHRGQR